MYVHIFEQSLYVNIRNIRKIKRLIPANILIVIVKEVLDFEKGNEDKISWKIY